MDGNTTAQLSLSWMHPDEEEDMDKIIERQIEAELKKAEEQADEDMTMKPEQYPSDQSKQEKGQRDGSGSSEKFHKPNSTELEQDESTQVREIVKGILSGLMQDTVCLVSSRSSSNKGPSTHLVALEELKRIEDNGKKVFEDPAKGN